MKNIFKILTISAVAFICVSCEDFLQSEPVDKISAEKYFSSEIDLQMYTNGLLDEYCPNAEDIALGDSFTDLTASKTSHDYYRPGAAWDATKQGGWSWGIFRKVNIMLRDMVRAKDNVSEEIYNHYEGVARFWRAYATFIKVKTFGDVPWIDHVIDVDDPILYAKRDDREYVMSKVLEDLNFACENCLGTERFHNVINKWVALTFKSRVCLYEGTYRKYHPYNLSTSEKKPWTNEYETAEDFLREAADASEKIMESGNFSLCQNFQDLFLSKSLHNNPEVIWHREYLSSEDFNAWHNLTLLFWTNTASQKVSPTKNLVNMFLKKDGNCIVDDKVSITEEFNERDSRLAMTIHAPGQTWKNKDGEIVPKPLNFAYTMTGYMFLKYSIEEELKHTAWSECDTSIPIMRYAEVLLNYAEAKAELNNGSISREDWDKSIGLLRQRAGVANIYPESGEYKEDTWLKAYYKRADNGAGDNLSNTILEIRRERATEMILEGLREDDMYRWHCANLIADRYDATDNGWRGIYITEDEAKNGFMFNGKKYTVSSNGTSETNYQISKSTADNSMTLSEGNKGYLIAHIKMTWDEKRYLRPIPTTAIVRNENLGQNYGW